MRSHAFDNYTPPPRDDDQEEELYEHFALTVDKGQSLMRIDRYLATHMEACSRSRIQAAADWQPPFHL